MITVIDNSGTKEVESDLDSVKLDKNDVEIMSIDNRNMVLTLNKTLIPSDKSELEVRWGTDGRVFTLAPIKEGDKEITILSSRYVDDRRV